MALPTPIPDNPLKWDGWRNYNSSNLYERLCLDHGSHITAEIIEDSTRQLLVWWQKKLPLKNQLSNPMAQLLRQGLDDAPQYLAEARTRLLDVEERAKHDVELHEELVKRAVTEFKKLIAFTISDKTLTEDGEARLIAAGLGMGLKTTDMLPVINAELESTGSMRVVAAPPPPPPPPPPPAPVPVAPAPAAVRRTPQANTARSLNRPQQDAKSPADEFRNLLRMSRLGLDGEEMSDDQRDAMCNLGESLGLSGGDAEDLIDEYLEEASMMPAAASSGSAQLRSASTQAPARPTAPVRPVTPVRAPAVSAAPKREVNLSPVALAEEKLKYSNFVNSVGCEMFFIPTGQFLMGSAAPDAQMNEQPVTTTIISCHYMARFPITNALYEQFEPAHRSKRGHWADDNHPVIYVSALEAEEFCKWLSRIEGRSYRLPTEAEWEYAARGPNPRVFPWGDRAINGTLANFADSRTTFAWRDLKVDDGYAETSPVGSYPRGASPFGVEDMAGNVFEWSADYLEPYKGKDVTNPRSQKVSSNRVYRGGSWKSRVSSLRCCARNSNMPSYQSNDVGFRIVCDCA